MLKLGWKTCKKQDDDDDDKKKKKKIKIDEMKHNKIRELTKVTNIDMKEYL